MEQNKDALLFFRSVLGTQNDAMLAELADGARHRFFHKGMYYVRSGNMLREVPFLERGMIGCQYLTMDGTMGLDNILDRKGFLAFSQCMLHQDQNTEEIHDLLFLTDGSVWEISLDTLEAAIKKYPIEMLKILHRIIAAEQHNHIEQMRMFHENPENRVMWLMETHPDWIERINHQYLARFIGITPVSFSRIRKRIFERAAAE